MMVRPAVPADRDWITSTLTARWGSTTIVTGSRRRDAAALQALVAVETSSEHERDRVGLLTYRVDRQGVEVVTIDSLKGRSGIGTALLARASQIARHAGTARVWLITTNDDLNAIEFYEHRGFRIVAVHEGAVDRARALKPSIPLVAENGIELHDELELALVLAPVPEIGYRTGPHAVTPTAGDPPVDAATRAGSEPFTIS